MRPGPGLAEMLRPREAGRPCAAPGGYNAPAMLMILYQALGAIAALALLALAPAVPALRRGLGERLGRAPRDPHAPGDADPAATRIWVHAASVGEVRAAEPLVEALLAERPAAQVIVSTFTASGRRLALETLADGEPRVRCTLLPLDWGFIPARVIRRERPALFILLETELWPVLLRALRRARVPVLVVNGRLSPRSVGRYRALAGLMGPALSAVTTALVRTRGDAERFAAIGLPAQRVRVAGNLKHARLVGDDAAGRRRRESFRSRLGARDGRPVLVAGSVRGPEGELMLAAFRRLAAAEPSLLLVLAPRHPERFDTAALREWEGSWVRWSAAPEKIRHETSVVLLDTIGELADCYAAATIACVGGTWADRGGHNLLEPAFHGVPVVFGPNFHHFDEEGSALLAAGGGFLAADGDALYARCRSLLGDASARAEAGCRAAQVALTFGGALERTLAAVREILGDAAGAGA